MAMAASMTAEQVRLCNAEVERFYDQSVPRRLCYEAIAKGQKETEDAVQERWLCLRRSGGQGCPTIAEIVERKAKAGR